VADAATAAPAPVQGQRERILDIALGLMAERGASGTSMRALADACGLNVAALYHYFPSKDALLRAVIEERRYGAQLQSLPIPDLRLPPEERVAALRARGAEVLGVPGGRPDLRLALEALLPRGVSSLLLEGGGTLAWGFLASALIDRVAWFVAPKLIGGAGTPGPLAGPGVARIDDAVRLEDLTTQLVGDDLLVMGRPRYPGSDQR